MKRKLGLTLAVFFLSVQLLGLLHMAEYSFKKHEHNGQTCSVYLAGEQSKYSITSDTVSSYPSDIVQSFTSVPLQAVVSCDIYPDSSPRAPPSFLRI